MFWRNTSNTAQAKHVQKNGGESAVLIWNLTLRSGLRPSLKLHLRTWLITTFGAHDILIYDTQAITIRTDETHVLKQSKTQKLKIRQSPNKFSKGLNRLHPGKG